MDKASDTAHVRDRITSRIAVEDRGYTSPCWISDRSTMDNGYTRMCHGGKVWLTHRLSYVMHVGPIPDDLVIDHLCRQRACANPDHLEPVTQRVNLHRGDGFIGQQSRRTRCIRGHALYGDNLYRAPNGSRLCRTCRHMHREASRLRNAA